MDVYQRRRLVALSAIAVIFIIFVLLIRSCGGDDETTPAPIAAGVSGATGASGPLSQADFIDQADAICLQANTSLANVDESDAATAANDQADIVAGELQQLQTLPAPEDGTDKLNKYLAALEKQATAYQDKATAAERGDDAAAADLDTTIDAAATDAADAADAFGFKVCGDTSKVGDSSSDTSSSDSTDSSSTSDTGGTVAPTTTSVAPATTTPAPVAPAPAGEAGGAAPAPTPAPTDGGTDGSSSSGGVSP